jgi:CheY-like chemotaxis protein
VEAAAIPKPPPLETAASRSLSILVIEDNDDARESLRFLLESLGHRVIEASDGPTGLALALHHRPGVVLIDLGLPGMSGYEAAQALRERVPDEPMTLIAITGYGQADDRRRSKEAGFDAHLVKPVSPGVLSSLIASVNAGSPSSPSPRPRPSLG